MRNATTTRMTHRFLTIALAIIAALTLAISMVSGIAPSSAYAANSNTQQKTQGGYWQLKSSGETSTPTVNQNQPWIREHHEYDASPTVHKQTDAVKYYGVENPKTWFDWKTNSWPEGQSPGKNDVVHLERVVFQSTCSAPPSTVKGGARVSFQLSLDTVENTVELYPFESHCEMLYYRGEADPNRSAGSMTPVGASTEGGDDCCGMSAKPGSEGYNEYTGFRGEVKSCEVAYTFPDPEEEIQRSPSSITIADPEDRKQSVTLVFYGCGSKTFWTYEWVEGEPVEEWETVVVPIVNQNDNINASNTPGTQNSNTIRPDIADPSDNGAWIIVPVIALAVIGGVAVAVYMRRRRTPKDPPPKNDNRQDEQQRYTYKMAVNKNFGDTMIPGVVYEVCARIDKQAVNAMGAPTAPAVPDPQMTSAITAVPVQNLELAAAPVYQLPYMVARVRVPEQPKNITTYPDAVLRFTYAGMTGAFNANVAFKVKANESILFCDEKGDGYSRGSLSADCLAGDTREVVYYFEAAEFVEEPRIDPPSITDPDLIVNIEKHIVPARPDGFFYKLSVKHLRKPFNQYDKWPYRSDFKIVARSRQQQAEASVKVSAWYDGLGIDISHIDQDKQFLGNAILIDTGDFPTDTKEANYDIHETDIGLVAAFRNQKGEVEVYPPNKPKNEDFPRIEPIKGDADSERSFSKDDPRCWYDLKFKHAQQDPANDDHRIDVLALKPIFPMLVENEGERSKGVFKAAYVDDEHGVRIEGEINYIFQGISEKVYKNDRDAEVKAIARILAGMNATGLEEANALLEQYGASSEKVRIKLGDDAKREALAATSKTIMAQVNNIHSVQRLRFMREELFRAAVRYCQKDGLTIAGVQYSWQGLADFCDAAYKIALLARWADDIMFSVWWVMLLGSKGAYVDAVMSPLKDWFLEYVEMLSTFYLDPDEEYQTAEQFFAPEKYWDKVVEPAIEGVVLNGMITAAATNGWSIFTNKKMLAAMGTFMCFVFANNCRKCAITDPKTGKVEFDLWKALKKTTGQLAAFTIKVVISAFLARKFFNKMKTVDNSGNAWKFENPEGFREKFWNLLMGGEELAKATANTVSGAAKRSVSSVRNLTQTMNGNEVVEMLQSLEEVGVGAAVDSSARVKQVVWDIDPKNPPNDLNWVRSFGSIVPLRAWDEEKGEMVTMQVPLLTAVFVFVDEFLAQTNFDSVRCLHMDYSTLLPDNCPYKTREEMVEMLKQHRIDVEAAWLSRPVYEIAGNYVGPSLTDTDSIVPQILYHPIRR